MYSKLVQVKTPQVFFKHELGELSQERLNGEGYRPGYIPKYFTFVDKDNKFVDNVIYIPYEDLNNKKYYGDGDLCVMKRCEEEKYSQHIINSCKKEYKKYGTKQYEWHLVKKSAVINTVIGECVFVAEHEMDYVYVYGNLIYCATYFGHNKKIYDWLGNVIIDDFKELFETKTHLIVQSNHDYRTGLDTVICINKLTGNIDNKYE